MQKLFLKKIIPIVFVVLMTCFFITGCSSSNTTQTDNNSKTSNVIPIRLGWQIPWALQGQLAQILKNTDILKQNNLAVDLIGFSSGAPLNEAALAGKVDVLFTGDQPAITLLSKDPNWVIIGRLMYNRVSLYVPPKSDIQKISDLKGKTVAMPFGAAAQRFVLKEEKNAGLNTEKDVKNINLGIYEQSDLTRDNSVTTWGNIDVMAGFDPTPAVFETKGLIRTLKIGKVVSVVVMSKKYIQTNPNAPIQFLRSLNSAYKYYRNNQDTANQWFIKVSKLDIPNEALALTTTLEPNLANGNNPIRLDFNDDDYMSLQEASDFLYDQKLIKSPLTIKDYIDTSYLK